MTTHWLHLASSALSALAVVLVAAAAGRRAAAALLPRGAAFALQFVFGAALGLGLLSYGTLFLGLCGFVSAGSAVALLALAAALGFRDLVLILRRTAEFLSQPREYTLSFPALAAAVLTGVFLLIALLGALAPPIYYDPLVYHFSVPKLFLLRGAVGPIPENVHSQYPSTVQMLYLIALQVNDDIAAQLLNFGMGLLLAAAVFLCGRRFCDRRTGLWAAAIVLTTEAFIMTLARAMVDPGLTLFLFLAFFALALWDEGGAADPRLLLLSGLLGGLGLSTKYTAFWLWIVLLGAAVVLARSRGQALGRALRAPLLLGALSFLVLLPWLIKSYCYTGNPVFPFFSEVFGGNNWDADAARRFAEYNAGMGGDIGWRNFWRLPLEMFFAAGSLENLTLGPLYLLAIPFLPGAGRRPRALQIAGIVALLYLPYWLLSAKILRYLVPVVPLAALVIAAAYTSRAPGSRARALFAAVIVASMLWNLRFFWVDELLVFEPAGVVLGTESREQYLARKLQAYAVMRHAGERLPRDAKILFVGETRAYHLERDHIANSAHDPSLIATVLRRAGTAEGTARELQRLGVTHILYHPDEAARLEETYGTFGWSEPEKKTLAEFLATKTRPLARINRVSLLELRDTAARPASQASSAAAEAHEEPR